MKPSRATSYLMLAVHFLAGALRARVIGGEALTKLSRLRASNARACFRDWLYHSRKAGAFTEATPVVESLHRAHLVEAALLRPLRQRAAATHLPAATLTPLTAMGAPAKTPDEEEPQSSTHGPCEDRPTTSSLASCPATPLSEPTGGTHDQPHHDTILHAPETQSEEARQECAQTDEAPAAYPPYHDSGGSKIHSSPDSAEQPPTAN